MSQCTLIFLSKFLILPVNSYTIRIKLKILKIIAIMNKYQDKEAAMDDYSHERKLRIDGRYEAAHGKMANAENDFDHAHALKKDAHYDAKNRKGGSYLSKHMGGRGV